jgi:hypothetical protein
VSVSALAPGGASVSHGRPSSRPHQPRQTSARFVNLLEEPPNLTLCSKKGRHGHSSQPTPRPTSRSRGWEGSLRNSDDSWLQGLALPLSAPSVHAIGRERDSSVARVARYRRIQSASPGSKVLNGERDHNTVALAQANERHAAMADGRPQDGASDGAVLRGRQCITCKLASPSHPPSHVTTPLIFVRDGVGALRSLWPSLVVEFVPPPSLSRSGAVARVSGADERGSGPRGRRGDSMLGSMEMAPRSRCGLPGPLVHGAWC